MNDPVDSLICDLLDWISKAERPYADVMDAWRTSCPRLPVWEEANDRGLIAHNGKMVALTSLGRAFLAKCSH